MFGTVFGDCTPDCIALHKMVQIHTVCRPKSKTRQWDDVVKWKKVIQWSFIFLCRSKDRINPDTFTGCTCSKNKFAVSDALEAFHLIVLLYKCCQHTDWQTQSQTTPKQKHNTVNYYWVNLGYQYFWFSASSQRLTRHVICVSFRATLDCASIHIHIPYYLANWKIIFIDNEDDDDCEIRYGHNGR